MNRKSISDLSTTLSSIKESFICNESDQNEITAIISSYTLKQDENKYFNKKYALYQIKFCTRYKAWSVQKRYSEFIELRDKLLLKKIKNIPKLPPKLYFTSEQKLTERQLGLEEFLNDLFKNVNILRYPEIIEFIRCPKEIIDILTYNMDYLNMINLNSSSIINTTDNNLYYKGRVTISNINRNNSDNHINKNDKDNFYCSLAKMNLNNDNNKKNNKNYFKEENGSQDEEEKISHGKIIIQEFLSNLIRTPYNKTELLYQFEYFLLNKNNEEDKSDSAFKWYFLTEEEIKIFFNGFYSNISHTKINGFLYHCGNISNNKIAFYTTVEIYQIIKSRLSNVLSF